MKILVTGANGYLGQGIVKVLLDNKVDVIATDFNTEGIDSRAIKVKSDIFSIKKPYESFGKPDVLLHLAWKDGFIHNSESHIIDFPKHYKFVSDFADAGISRIAVMGSMHEIGFYEGSINENTPCKPMSLYGISKNALREATELICEKKNVKFQWLRGYYIVSNYSYGNSIFSKITSAVEEGKKEFPFTMGQNQYDFLNYHDFCNRVAHSVMQSNILGIINICSGKPEKLADVVEKFIEDNNYDIELKYGMFPDRPYDSKAVWGDSRKIDEIMSKG